MTQICIEKLHNNYEHSIAALGIAHSSVKTSSLVLTILQLLFKNNNCETEQLSRKDYQSKYSLDLRIVGCFPITVRSCGETSSKIVTLPIKQVS